MTPTLTTPAADEQAEISGLIETLVATERRLAELTAGQVDSVCSVDGQTFLLHRAQEEVRKREADRQVAVLDALPAYVALLGPQGGIVSVNEAWRRFSGPNVIQSPGHAVGLNYLEICARAAGDPGSHAQQIGRGIRAVLAGQQNNFSIEYSCAGRKETTWFLMTVNPLAEAGRLGAVTMHVDITERKRAEEELRSSEERFAKAFDHAPIGVTLATPDGRWLKVNRAFCEMVGYSEAELLALTFQDITFPADHPANADYIRKMAAMEIDRYTIEKRYVHRLGHLVTAIQAVSLVKDAGERPRYLVAQIQDISRRRTAELALKKMSEETERRERLLSTALSSMIDFAQIYDRAGRLLFANQPLLDLWGRTSESVIGRTFLELDYPADLAARLTRQIQGVFETKQRVTDETAYSDPAGQEGFYEYIFSPVLARDGTVDFVVGSTREITERKRAGEALRISQATLATAQRIAHFGSWELDLANTTDPDANALRWSDEMFRIAGFEPGAVAVTNDLFFSLIPPEEHAPIRQALAAAIRTRDTYSIVHRLVRPDGTVRIVEEKAQIFLEEKTGNPLRIVGTAHDITERRKTQDDLARSEREQRQLAEQLDLERARLVEAQAVAKVGSWETDLATYILIWSAETYRVFAVDPAAFDHTHAGFLQLVHHDDRAAVDRAFAQSLLQPAACAIEHRILLPDGRIKFVEQRWQPVFDALGQAVRAHGTCQDITERKLGMEALRVSEKRFKALFEQAAVGVAQTDAKTGRFVQVNQRFCTMVGRTREEMEHLTFESITHPNDAARGLDLVARLTAGALREQTDETRYLRKDGSEVWANVTISAMWAPGEAPDSFIAVALDVTEKKRFEDQLRQAQKMDAIGTLAGGIAHDFNNILAAINGYTELSRMSLKDNPEVREHLGAVLQAVSRATALVRQILTFSRQQPLARRPIQLLPVVAETLTLLRATIPSTIEFETALPTNAPMVLADSSQIHQILMNLGTNAWHAMRAGTGRLKVTLERCEVDATHAHGQPRLRPGLYARVSVSDTGMGMDEATQRRIFEPFFTTKPPGEGTGLGLAVVHGIMDSHEGAITVYSQPGEGTIFRLYFPAHAGEISALAPAVRTMPRGQGQKILFVDDEELLVHLGRKALTALGYTVETAIKPAAALALVRAEPGRFALVITDMTMPQMTGLALASELQLIRRELPIILTTGYGQSLTRERIAAAGLRQVLLKPFTIHSLGEAVHAALSPQTAAAETYGSNPPY